MRTIYSETGALDVHVYGTGQLRRARRWRVSMLTNPKTSVPLIMQQIKDFEEGSDFKLNYSKLEAMTAILILTVEKKN